eukprot:TRINITY_DN79951_c0_g1_i1.p1 TRINITY_DN79951_c0_g1~~TRINITY_DN79951_c0_g1_i1.p1  ORF type:complete len:231 (-),score=18.52 TRINITY_DN79951_c0_g1_i1:230-922(-)
MAAISQLSSVSLGSLRLQSDVSRRSATNHVRIAVPRTGKVGRSSELSSRPVVTATVAPPEEKKQEKIDWAYKRKNLVKKVKSVVPAEAARLARDEGHVIIDVRTVAEHKEVHPAGAVSAEFYRLIKEWTPYHVLRRAAFAFFGVFNGTEENPEFVKLVEAAVPDKATPIIVACMPGGTLKPTKNFPMGKESRSLNAAYVLLENGYSNIVHIEGGIYDYLKADLPVGYVNE